MSKEQQVTVFEIDGIEDKLGHGGVRKGAGRKKSEPTATIRVCDDLAVYLKQLSDQYKQLEPEQRQAVRHDLAELIDTNARLHLGK